MGGIQDERGWMGGLQDGGRQKAEGRDQGCGIEGVQVLGE